MRNMYHVMCEATLPYGIFLGGVRLHTVYIKQLEIIQKPVIKHIYNKSPTFPTSSLYNETKL